MVEVPEELLTEHAELERRLADPAVQADHAKVRDLGRRYATVHRIVETHDALVAAEADLQAARELAAEDGSFTAEADALQSRKDELAGALRQLLMPRDPAADKDVLLEVRAGAGGEESALFAGDLLRMYTRYSERQGFSVEVLDSTESELGGYKDATLAVKAKGHGEPGAGPYGLLRFEAGVHRVQRVPVTESQGRIHTSAAGVLVFPEAEEFEVQIEEKDLRIDVFRSSGPGGQSVNTTDSAVRITHQPTGVVVSCQNERSQLQNRERAMRMLRAKLLAMRQEEAEREQADARRSQVRTVDRSERVRTYNFPENRISDHRTGYKAYNLDQVLEGGGLEPVIGSLVDADAQERLAPT